MADPISGDIAAAMGGGDVDEALDRWNRLYEQGAFQHLAALRADIQFLGRLNAAFQNLSPGSTAAILVSRPPWLWR